MWEALEEIVGFLVDLWQTGNRRVRRAVVGILILVVIPAALWPFVLLGVSFIDWFHGTWITPVVSLLPIVGISVLVTILAVAYPLLSGIVVAIPRGRRLLGKLFLWLAILVFAELVVGLYFASVRVWNDPGLIPLLVLLVVVLGMLLVLKRQFGWQGRSVRWFTGALVFGIAAITITFFIGGRDRLSQWWTAEEALAAVKISTGQEFTFNAGQEVSTIYIEEGMRFDACSNRRWRMGRASIHEIPAGCICVSGPGRVWATGMEDGTVLRFERRKS